MTSSSTRRELPAGRPGEYVSPSVDRAPAGRCRRSASDVGGKSPTSGSHRPSDQGLAQEPDVALVNRAQHLHLLGQTPTDFRVAAGGEDFQQNCALNREDWINWPKKRRTASWSRSPESRMNWRASRASSSGGREGEAWVMAPQTWRSAWGCAVAVPNSARRRGGHAPTPPSAPDRRSHRRLKVSPTTPASGPSGPAERRSAFPVRFTPLSDTRPLRSPSGWAALALRPAVLSSFGSDMIASFSTPSRAAAKSFPGGRRIQPPTTPEASPYP